MSARKLESSSGVFSDVNVQARKTSLTLPAGTVSISKNGIEFRSPTAIAPWTEMTVDLQSPRSTRKLHCTGVVVACNGSRHAGYHVSMLFTGLSRQTQAQLNLMAYS
jgi:PilZ domain-containing protein